MLCGGYSDNLIHFSDNRIKGERMAHTKTNFTIYSYNGADKIPGIKFLRAIAPLMFDGANLSLRDAKNLFESIANDGRPLKICLNSPEMKIAVQNYAQLSGFETFRDDSNVIDFYDYVTKASYENGYGDGDEVEVRISR
jgi:hypothetical protein